MLPVAIMMPVDMVPAVTIMLHENMLAVVAMLHVAIIFLLLLLLCCLLL